MLFTPLRPQTLPQLASSASAKSCSLWRRSPSSFHRSKSTAASISTLACAKPSPSVSLCSVLSAPLKMKAQRTIRRSPPKTVGNGLLNIGTRSLEVYNESVVILSFRDAALLAAIHHPPFQFRWLSEPDDLDAVPGPGLFHPMF